MAEMNLPSCHSAGRLDYCTGKIKISLSTESVKEDGTQTANPCAPDRIQVPELEQFQIITFNVIWMSTVSINIWHLRRSSHLLYYRHLHQNGVNSFGFISYRKDQGLRLE